MELYEAIYIVSAFASAIIAGHSAAGSGKRDHTSLQQNTQHVHVTYKAADKKEDVWCYQCETMEAEDQCVDLRDNRTSMIRKCPDADRICSVKRITYTTLLDNGTLTTRMWSLARSCAQRCDAGCIVMGERTKLHACTACCETSLCNTMASAAPAPHRAPHGLVTAALAALATLLLRRRRPELLAS